MHKRFANLFRPIIANVVPCVHRPASQPASAARRRRGEANSTKIQNLNNKRNLNKKYIYFFHSPRKSTNVTVSLFFNAAPIALASMAVKPISVRANETNQHERKARTIIRSPFKSTFVHLFALILATTSIVSGRTDNDILCVGGAPKSNQKKKNTNRRAGAGAGGHSMVMHTKPNTHIYMSLSQTVPTCTCSGNIANQSPNSNAEQKYSLCV